MGYRRSHISSWILAGTVLLVGCSGESLMPVSGDVTLDGNPIEKGTIRFMPVDGVGPAAEAKIEQGRYEVLVPAGKKNVFIRGLKTIGHNYPSGPEGPAIPDYEELVPTRYERPGAIQCTIVEGDPRRDFELAGEP